MTAAALLLAAADAKFSFVMPWFCLERCGDASADIQAEFWQLAVNRSAFTGVSFEDYNLGANSVLLKNNLTQMAGPLKALGLQRWAMVSSFPYPTTFLAWMRQVFAAPQPFIDACLAAAKAEDLTGFNIDWEPTDGGGDPTPQDAKDYAAFLTTFSDAMHGAGVLTSVDVASWSAIWDYSLLAASSVDYIMTMSTYTGRDSLFGPALADALASIPLSKLVVGLETVNDDTNAPFNDTALQLRFDAINTAGVDKIALWRAGVPDNWWPYLQAA